jgi:hypothetical protein
VRVKREGSGVAAPGGRVQEEAKMGDKMCISMKKNLFLPSTTLKLLSQRKINTISDSIFKCIISVRSGHCY